MRYFLFTYWQLVGGETSHGNLLVSGSVFPSGKSLVDSVMSNAFYTHSKLPESVVITGWNEFKDEEDYLNFKGEE